MLPKIIFILTLCVVLESYICMFKNYSSLPDSIPIHLNFKGGIYKYLPRCLIIFFPIMMTILFVVLNMLPKFDTFPHNYRKFQTEFYLLILTIVSFLRYMCYLYIQLAHKEFNVLLELMPGAGIMFIILGFCIMRSKMNTNLGCNHAFGYTSNENWAIINKYFGLTFMIPGGIAIIGYIVKSVWFIVGGMITMIAGIILVNSYGSQQLSLLEKINDMREEIERLKEV